jgi:hypothetical protein
MRWREHLTNDEVSTGGRRLPLAMLPERPAQTLVPDASYTLLLRVDAATDADALGVSGARYVGRDLGHAPHHDAGDRWLVDSALCSTVSRSTGR